MLSENQSQKINSRTNTDERMHEGTGSSGGDDKKFQYMAGNQGLKENLIANQDEDYQEISPAAEVQQQPLQIIKSGSVTNSEKQHLNKGYSLPGTQRLAEA